MGRSETKKVTDKEPTRPVRNTRTWMKTTSYGKTKQHLFVGLLLGVIVLSTQAQALSIVCCQAHNAQCESCKQGISEEEYCKKAPSDFFGPVPGCEKYQSGGGGGKGCCRANTADCLACSAGLSEEEYCKKKKNRDVPGCEKYHKGDGGKGCCRANTAECLACSEGKSVKRFCKKYKNRDVPGCEKYHRRGSLGEKDRDDSRQKEDRDDSRQQEDGGFFRWLLQQLFGG